MNVRKTERVELVVLNKPGVLGRVAGHIRREGWNIKRLAVDEDKPAGAAARPKALAGTSTMEIDIEGAHTKLAQVMDRILNLDCVVSITMIQNGKKVVRRRPQDTTVTQPAFESAAAVPSEKQGRFRILAINPGSTSTKFSLFDDDKSVLTKTIQHDPALLSPYASALDQK
ncbi:MAG: hypothetical protein LBH35_06850, partial [Treponema sp.]|nr:hypothetical protein [Treponema sp.]